MSAFYNLIPFVLWSLQWWCSLSYHWWPHLFPKNWALPFISIPRKGLLIPIWSLRTDCTSRILPPVYLTPVLFPSLPTLVHTSSLLLDFCVGQLFTSLKFQGACTCPNFTPEVRHASEFWKLDTLLSLLLLETAFPWAEFYLAHQSMWEGH